MKKVKLYLPLLAVLAAMGSLAIAGTAQASTVLCKTSAEPCTSALKAGEVLKATTTSAKLATNSGDYTCSSSISVKLTESAGEPLHGQLTEFTATGCKAINGTTCEMASVNPGATAALYAEGGGSGSLNVLPGTLGYPGWKQVCGFQINCRLTLGEGNSLLVNGGAPGYIAVEEVLDAQGGACYSKNIWVANYKIQTNSGSIWLSQS